MKRFIEDYGNTRFDVLVIGGGITGAAMAYEAASRGLSVALVEKKDFSCATSAATSKLIHGGLRYLNNLEFGLVRESLRERKTLENIAPNFVHPYPMMWIHNSSSLKNNKWFIKVGMILYDLLSFDRSMTWDISKKIPSHQTISPQEVLIKEPNVRRTGLRGASLFYDCVSIFPERLTLAFIKSAVRFGAQVANYTKVEGFVMDGEDKVTGVEVTDLLNGKTVKLDAGIVVNCSGPWADIILGLAKPGGVNEQLRRSEGIHIVTKKLVNSHVVGYTTRKGRHFFLIPWRGHTLIGTTDKEYQGSPDEYRVTKQSILELIDEVNESFGDGTLCYDDVLFAYGGLRPLVEDQTQETYTTSRKYEVYDNAADGLEGLITVEGGKYTTSRNLAQTTVKLVEKKLCRNLGRTITDKLPLCGCEIADMNEFVFSALRNNRDFSMDTVVYLARNYGTEYESILAMARGDECLKEVLNDDSEILAQVTHAVRNEMARSLSDIIFRRTGIATLGNPGIEVLEKVASCAARELNWSQDKIDRELQQSLEMLKLPVN
ncbi:MAG: FAD-dependent oxidoreductase [Desulfomonilia bacterium]